MSIVGRSLDRMNEWSSHVAMAKPAVDFDALTAQVHLQYRFLKGSIFPQRKEVKHLASAWIVNVPIKLTDSLKKII